MAEHGAAVRVLLLARAGEARQRLESALAEAGAELVASIDPSEGEAADAVALAPRAVLVALEPAIEDSLERYDALLSDPGTLVMFDEAEVAARREGWDAARWVRHLAAKLTGHHAVLPPGAGPDDVVHPVPGSLPEREFDPTSIDLGALADTAQDLAAEVPRAEDFNAAGAPQEPDLEPGSGLELEPLAEAGPEPDLDPEPESEPELPTDADAVVDEAAAPAAGFSGLLQAEDMDWSSSSDVDGVPLADDPAVAALLAGSGAAVPADGDEAVVDGSFDAPAAAADDAAADAADEAVASADGDAGGDGGTNADGNAGDAVDPLSLGDGLSLADDDAPPPTIGGGPAAAVDLDALASRLDGLSLADPDSYGHGVLRGAVVVEAGLGGPDAVRQLLGGLGEDFPRAVLVRLQLDGGRYDRLVQQMQRATALPVALAEAGASAESGTVYFLPPDVDVAVDRARLVFTTGEGAGHYATLPADDSAVVFLSGAQLARVDDAMALAEAGALVFAQSSDSCYDSAAVDALLARGGTAAEPADLAQALLDRWP